MRRNAVLSAAAFVAAVTATSTRVNAQGFGVYEHDACMMARAGTGVASPCNASAVFFNPAGIVGGGNRWNAQVGVTMIAPRGDFTDSITGATTPSTPNNIPVPTLFVTRQLGSRWAVGLGVNAPYGLISEWPNTFEGRFLAYRADLKSIYIQPTIAYRIHPRVRVGAGVTIVHSQVELKQRVDLSEQEAQAGVTFAMLGVPTGTDFADATLNATGNSVGGHFGLLAQLTDRFSIGARFLTKVTVDLEGDATFRPVPTGITLAAGNPLGAPAGTPLDNVVSSAFTTTLASQTGATTLPMPAQLVVGVALRATNDLTVLADYQWVNWKSFEVLPLDFSVIGQDTLYEDYQNTSGYRVGAEYVASPKVTLRGGLLFHTAAAPDQTVTPLLPEGERAEGTLGLGIRLSPRARLDLAYQYIRQQDRRGRVTDPPARGPAGASANTGVYTSTANLFGASLAFGF
jgi:long-chain fatty acid transport protein